MTEEEIKRLKQAVKINKRVVFISDNGEFFTVAVISSQGNEPSECAYFRGGKYVALYNVELSDFKIITPIK